jgi:hypothetical protein
MLTSKDDGDAWIDVYETNAMTKLGTMKVANGSSIAQFDLDGRVLYAQSSGGYVAWHYASGVIDPMSELAPNVSAGTSSDVTGWNSDRTIGIRYPKPTFVSIRQKAPRDSIPGEIVAGGSVSYEIPPDNKAGFDQFGHAWFGNESSWTEVDRAGRETKRRTKPTYLVHDQTEDRGSMQLRATRSVMNFNGSKAYICCVWLCDDRASVMKRISNGKLVRDPDASKAALIFAGPDVLAYGFFPGRNMAYVVCAGDSYLVPFRIDASKKRVASSGLK